MYFYYGVYNILYDSVSLIFQAKEIRFHIIYIFFSKKVPYGIITIIIIIVIIRPPQSRILFHLEIYVYYSAHVFIGTYAYT